MKRNLIRLVVMLSLLVFPWSLYAQTVTGSLPIRVLDRQNAAIPGATVTIRNVETGLERTQTTDADGLTTFVGLPPGKYSIRVERPGFKTFVDENVDVGVSRSEKRDVQMEPGLVAETITVSGTAEVGEDPLEILTNIDNDLTLLRQIVPGAAAANAAALGRIVPDAKGKEGQTLRLDGLDVTPLTDLPTGDPVHSVLDTFLKTNVSLNSALTVTHAGAITFEPPGGGADTYAPSPMYGPGSGTLLEGISYKGTDGKVSKRWKFQLNEAVRNDALNAPNYFDAEGRNPLRRNQFGGKVGGPLFNDKGGLFFGYDGIRARSERAVYEAVPADAVCLCGGGPVATFLGGFLPPGTTIVPGDISKDKDFLVARRRVRATSDANAWDARFDQTIPVGDGYFNSLTLRFTRQAADFIVPDGVTGRRQRQGVTLSSGLVQFNMYRGDHEHHLRFGVNQTRSFSFVEVPPTTDPSLTLSLITVGNTVDVSNLPGNPATVPVATLGGLVRGSARGFDQTPTSFNASYDLIATLSSNHLLETGFEARFIRLDFDRFGGLTYTFPNIAGLRTGKTRVVNFLSDLSAQSPFNAGGKRRAAQEYYLSYFQMISQFSRARLTYGLRYDYFDVAREQNDRAIVLDPHTGETLPIGTSFYKASKLNFQPRVGLSYSFRENSIVRAGAGFYSGSTRIGDLLLPIESDRFNTGLKEGIFPVTPAEVIKNFVENEETRLFQPLSFARDFTTPERIFKWDVMMTHTFGTVNDVNVVYSGNIGRNLPAANIANPIISVQTNPDPTQPAIVRRQFDIESNGFLSQPFGELQFRTSKGSSSFNGLTFQFKRNNRLLGTSEHWLDWKNFTSFNAQYTLGRNVGNVSGAVAASTLDFESDFGFNTSDVRHVFSLTTGYKLWDDANGRNRRDIVWGWTISPTITARSGAPIIVRLDRPDVVYVDATGQIFNSQGVGRQAIINTPGGGASGGTRVPNLIPGANPILRDGLQFLDPRAFAVPAPGEFGNLRRGQVRGPGSFQVDLTFTRVLFYKTEAGKGKNIVGADLKIEVANVFNRVNFINPPATLSVVGDRIQPSVPFSRLTAGPVFGVFNAADVGRQIQFTLVFKFNEGF
jgi:hypothetical protein